MKKSETFTGVFIHAVYLKIFYTRYVMNNKTFNCPGFDLWKFFYDVLKNVF